MLIRELPSGEQPREKLIQRGADALSDAELLAVLLRTGYQGVSVVQLAQQLLAEAGGLQPLLQWTRADFCRRKGLGLAKYVQLHAALALARRTIEQQLCRRTLNSPEEVVDYLRLQLAGETREVFGVLYLDNANAMLHFAKLFAGSLNAAQVHVAEVMRSALEQRASALILCHNHPSGKITPSRADDQVTRRIAEAAGMLDIRLLDHVIVGSGKVYSYAANNPRLLQASAQG